MAFTRFEPAALAFAATCLGVAVTGQDRREAAQPATIKIAGRCLDHAKIPVPRAKVHLYRHDYREHRSQLVRSGITDAAGKFSFAGIQYIDPVQYGWEFYYLLAEAAQRAVGVATLRSKSIQLDKLELHLLRSAKIKGVVRDDAGKPVPRARVWVMMFDRRRTTGYRSLWLSRPHVLLQTMADAQGRFTLGNVPEDMQLMLCAEGPLHAPQRLNCAAPDEVEFELSPGGIVTGRVVFADGKPAASVQVATQGLRNGGWATTRTDQDGRFKLESLKHGACNIWAAKKAWTVKALDSFDVVGGKTRKAPDLVLVRGGFIIGKVIDTATGKPVRPGAGSDVGIYGPSRPRSGAAIEAAQIQKDGTFRIRAAPGNNYIYLRARPGWTSGTAKNVEVEEGKIIEVEFAVQRRGSKRGGHDITVGRRR